MRENSSAWQLGSLTACQLDSLTAWHLDSLAAWQLDNATLTFSLLCEWPNWLENYLKTSTSFVLNANVFYSSLYFPPLSVSKCNNRQQKGKSEWNSLRHKLFLWKRKDIREVSRLSLLTFISYLVLFLFREASARFGASLEGGVLTKWRFWQNKHVLCFVVFNSILGLQIWEPWILGRHSTKFYFTFGFRIWIFPG